MQEKFVRIQRAVYEAAGFVDVSSDSHADFAKPIDAPAGWQSKPVKIRVFGSPVFHASGGGESGVDAHTVEASNRVLEVDYQVAVQRIVAGTAELVTA